MATIRKQGKNYMVIVSNGRDHNYKQIIERKTFRPDASWSERRTEQELQKFVIEFEAQVKGGQLYKKSKMFFSEFADKWFSEYVKTNLAINTQSNYRDVLRNHLVPALGKYRMHDLSSFRLQSFLNGYYKDGELVSYSAGTVQKVRNVLRSIFRKAYQWEILPDNPMSRVYLPRSTQTSEPIKFFTQEQTQRFLNYISQPYVYTVPEHISNRPDNSVQQISEYTMSVYITKQIQIFFILLIYGGFRRGEALALTWDDIDFDKNEISINKSASYHNKVLIVKEPKTRGSIRTVAMPEAVMKQLAAYKCEQEKEAKRLEGYWQHHNFVFTQDNGKMMSQSTPYIAFKNAITRYNETHTDEAEKLPNIPLHGLRHTSATIMLSNRANLSAVAARLGHSQTSTTLNVYAHAIKSADYENSDILDSALKLN